MRIIIKYCSIMSYLLSTQLMAICPPADTVQEKLTEVLSGSAKTEMTEVLKKIVGDNKEVKALRFLDLLKDDPLYLDAVNHHLVWRCNYYSHKGIVIGFTISKDS